MSSTLNNAMCRCCASQGTFKDLKTSFHWMGEEEIYSEMLRECFDITLYSTDDGDDGGICEVCITQLRNAANFKKQVQHTEEEFQRRVRDGLYKYNIVKEEVSRDDEEPEVESENENNMDDDFSGNDFEVPIKEESEPEEQRPKKRAAPRAAASRAKKPKADAGAPSTKRTTRSSKTVHSRREPENVKLKKDLNFSSFIAIKPTKKRARNKKEPIDQKSRVTELDLQLENARTILRCSNATPIRCRVGSRYACSYCFDQFSRATDLKEHTTQTHLDENERPDFLSVRSLSRHVVYLDITSLRCTLCNEKQDNLQDLMHHLKKQHKEKMHTELNNHIVPFKFGGDAMKCVVCEEKFTEFETLQEHMSSHYRNYSCEFCEAGFINRSMMIDHKKAVHNVLQKIKYRRNV